MEVLHLRWVSSWLYPAENAKMNGAEGPEIIEAKIHLRLSGREWVWSVAEPWGRMQRKTMLWSNALTKQGWPTAGTPSTKWEPG